MIRLRSLILGGFARESALLGFPPYAALHRPLVVATIAASAARQNRLRSSLSRSAPNIQAKSALSLRIGLQPLVHFHPRSAVYPSLLHNMFFRTFSTGPCRHQQTAGTPPPPDPQNYDDQSRFMAEFRQRTARSYRLLWIRRGLFALIALVLTFLLLQKIIKLPLALYGNLMSLYGDLVLLLLQRSEIKDKSVLHIPLNKLVFSDAPVANGGQSIRDIESILDQRERVAMFDLCEKIRLAGEDKRIRAIVLDLSPPFEGRTPLAWASVQEVYSALKAFKVSKKEQWPESEKTVIAFSPSYDDQKMFFLAQAADEIAMSPVGNVALVGLSAQSLFYKQLFDRIGVDVHAEAREDYKSAVAPYTMTKWNEPSRGNLQRLLDDLQSQASQYFSNEEYSYEDLISNGPWLATKAANHKFLSTLTFLRNIFDEFEERGNNILSWKAYSRALEISRQVVVKYASNLSEDHLSESTSQTDTMTQSSASGAVLAKSDSHVLENNKDSASNNEDGSSKMKEKSGKLVKEVMVVWAGDDEEAPKPDAKVGVVFCDAAIGNRGRFSADHIAKQLHKAAADSSIDVILFRMNSPGGDAVASETIWNAVNQAMKKKPVIASYGDTSASGGYLATCGASTIFANAATLTGSIGVFGIRPNVAKVLPKVHVNTDIVKTNDNVSFFDIFQEMSERDKEMYKRLIDNIYDHFKGKVAAERGLSAEAVQNIAGGRVFTGLQALENKIIDRIGGFHDALEYCIQLALKNKTVCRIKPKRPASQRVSYSYECDGKTVDVLFFPKQDRISLLLEILNIFEQDDKDMVNPDLDGIDSHIRSFSPFVRLLWPKFRQFLSSELFISLCSNEKSQIASIDDMIKLEMPEIKINS